MVTVNSNPNPTPAPAPAVPATDSVLADLDVLITAGVVERTVEPMPGGPFAGMLFTMHTLKNPERNLVAQEIPNESLSSAAAVDHAPKIPTLVHAITCIEKGGKKYMFVTPEQKAMLRTLLSSPNIGAIIIDELYLQYLTMVDDLLKIIETGVKKN